MTPGYWLFLVILIFVISISIRKEKLTIGGGISGGVVGWLIFLGAGFTGVAMIGLFFVLGTAATSWKTGTKEKLGVAERDKGKRRATQVFANGGMAAIAGLLSWFFPASRQLFQLMMAASLASATADTLSSELGTVYGKRFYNIMNFQIDKRGENGVVSMEGTLIGFFGSIFIAVVYATGFGWDIRFCWIILSGTIGNIADSILGATLERKHYLKNDAVNFINTIIASIALLILTKLF